MDATFMATLRRLFPGVSLIPPEGGETVALGAVVNVDIRDLAFIVTLEHGAELRFHADVESWRVMDAHLKTGGLSFEDPEIGLRKLAEILGTLRAHLDA